ncbi:MAG: SH3 domain-containing protein [Myxococcota bacterium]
MILLSLMSALAQAPVVVTPGSTVEVVYVAGEEGVASKRFVTDAAASHVKFEPGRPLRVLFRENGWVRVREGEQYGWLPAKSVTADSPLVMPAIP